MLARLLGWFAPHKQSPEDLAEILFTLTVDNASEDASALLKALSKVEGIDLNIARRELMFLRFSAVYLVLPEFSTRPRLQGSKFAEVDSNYVARLKGLFQAIEAKGGGDFFELSMARLAAYHKADTKWCEAHEKGRGHEQTFAIGERFMEFCGVEKNNPFIMSTIRFYFHEMVIAVTNKLAEWKFS